MALADRLVARKGTGKTTTERDAGELAAGEVSINRLALDVEVLRQAVEQQEPIVAREREVAAWALGIVARRRLEPKARAALCALEQYAALAEEHRAVTREAAKAVPRLLRTLPELPDASDLLTTVRRAATPATREPTHAWTPA